jgi:hypothetical protein
MFLRRAVDILWKYELKSLISQHRSAANCYTDRRKTKREKGKVAILVVLAEGGGGLEPITSKGPGALFFERLFNAQQFKRTRSSGTYV